MKTLVAFLHCELQLEAADYDEEALNVLSLLIIAPPLVLICEQSVASAEFCWRNKFYQ